MIARVLGRLDRLYEGLILAMAVLAAAIAGGLVVLICVDVIGRNSGLGNLPWTNEVTEYGLYGMTMMAAPWVLSLGAHVRMDLFSRVLPGPASRLMEVTAAVLGAAICGLLAWYGLIATLASHARGSLILKTLVFPEWMLLVFLPVTLALLAIGFLRRAVAVARGQIRPEDDTVTGAG